MKPLMFILAIYALFLAVKPEVDVISFQVGSEQTCCGQTCTPRAECDASQEDNCDTNCEGKSCNPFQVCSTCVLDEISTSDYEIPKAVVFSTNTVNFSSTITSQFAPDFWQPPKIIEHL